MSDESAANDNTPSLSSCLLDQHLSAWTARCEGRTLKIQSCNAISADTPRGALSSSKQGPKTHNTYPILECIHILWSRPIISAQADNIISKQMPVKVLEATVSFKRWQLIRWGITKVWGLLLLLHGLDDSPIGPSAVFALMCRRVLYCASISQWINGARSAFSCNEFGCLANLEFA